MRKPLDTPFQAQTRSLFRRKDANFKDGKRTGRYAVGLALAAIAINDRLKHAGLLLALD